MSKKNDLISIRRIKHVQKNSSFNVPTYNDDDFFPSLKSLKIWPFVAYKSYLGFLLIDGIGKNGKITSYKKAMCLTNGISH